jgi:hypothetical protein
MTPQGGRLAIGRASDVDAGTDCKACPVRGFARWRAFVRVLVSRAHYDLGRSSTFSAMKLMIILPAHRSDAREQAFAQGARALDVVL